MELTNVTVFSKAEGLGEKESVPTRAMLATRSGWFTNERKYVVFLSLSFLLHMTILVPSILLQMTSFQSLERNEPPRACGTHFLYPCLPCQADSLAIVNSAAVSMAASVSVTC